jgi:hypothetical protein
MGANHFCGLFSCQSGQEEARPSRNSRNILNDLRTDQSERLPNVNRRIFIVYSSAEYFVDCDRCVMFAVLSYAQKEKQNTKNSKEENKMDNNMMIISGSVIAVLTLISRILLFRKAGRSGWLAVIPVVSC